MPLTWPLPKQRRRRHFDGSGTGNPVTGATRGKPHAIAPLPAVIAFATGVLLMVSIGDLPQFGAADAPVHVHVAPDYISGSAEKIGVPNVVTSVLASYRGYDTLGETVVIFTAAIAVLLILAGWTRAL